MAKKRHPELRLGEVFITNASEYDFHNTVGWKTKRMGKQAYDANGEPLPEHRGYRPVFAQKSELDKAGVTISA